MTFLSPAPALVAALIAAPALLLLYFLKLRRRPLRVSSTMLWEQAVRDLQVNVPFRMLRVTFLLLLQLAILALVLLALARPAINARGDAPPRVVLLIDRSASMSAGDGPDGATRLEAARRAANEYIASTARRSAAPAIAVIAFAAGAEALGPLSTDPRAARAAVESITPTDQPGDLAGALRLASAMITGETDESAARTGGLVVLFSDGSYAPDAAYTLPGAEFRFQRVGPDPGTRADNLGIVALAARRDWDDPATVRVFARLQNAGDQDRAIPLILSLDGREIERRAVTVPAGEPPGAGAPAVPGESAATFSLSTREGGVAELRLERPDLLGADDRAALVIAAATKPRITLVIPDRAPSPDGAPVRGPEWILRDLVEEMALPLRIRTASAYASTSPADLGADLVIFDRVTPAVAPPVASISFGGGLPITGLAAGLPLDQGTYVISWDRSSPILRHVALDTLYAGRPLALQTPARGSGVEELARGASGPLMLLSRRNGPPRLVIGFELAQSNWPLQVGFPIFMAAAIDELTLRADERAGRFFTTAEPVQIEGLTGTVTLDGPRRLTATARDGAGANFGRLESSGVYRVSAPDGPDGAVAVNLLDPLESALETRAALRVAGEEVAAVGPGEGPRELWPLFMIAALVLLTVEWFLNAWLMRV